MSDDNIQHINVDDEQWDSAPRALRDHVDRLQKALKSANQQITVFETERASSALSGALTGFKNPERVKAAILGDKIDPLDSEAVNKWLTENGDDYARASEAPVTPVEDEFDNDEPDPRLAAQERLNAFQSAATPGGADPLSVIQSMPQDLSPAAAREWLLAHGA